MELSQSNSELGVSVIIPAYNYAHYLHSAIGSILAQTWQNLEVIVVDDGSKDATRETVGKETDPRVRYVWQENAGLSAARNTGIREARYPFVAFLDADDLWEKEFLSSVMNCFQRLPPEFALIATHTSRMDANGRPVQNRKAPKAEPDRELTAKEFVLRNRPFSSTVVIRRNTFESCGWFDTSLRSSEDRDMWIRIAMRYRTWFLGEPLGIIRRHPENMSKNADRMKRNSRHVMLKAWRAGAVSKFNIPFWLRAFSVHFFQIAWTHFDEGKRPRAMRYLITSLVLCPFFLNPKQIHEPPLFRVRAFAKFFLSFLKPRPRT